MKKVLSITFAVLAVAVLLGSCKSHERCPAYSKVEQAQKQSV
jgi:PBP1b-binding outer membrane lipoprotein LpoB